MIQLLIVFGKHFCYERSATVWVVAVVRLIDVSIRYFYKVCRRLAAIIFVICIIEAVSICIYITAEKFNKAVKISKIAFYKFIKYY